jgi:NADH-quinone oxidoreductase subunit C
MDLNDLVQQKLKDKFGELVSDFIMHYDILTFETPKENNLKVLTFLKEDPELQFDFLNDFTAVNLFSTANWLEREAYDFFGVNFVGHPNLIRIMNVDEMDYFPLRKEYPVEDQTRIDKDDDMFGR